MSSGHNKLILFYSIFPLHAFIFIENFRLIVPLAFAHAYNKIHVFH